VKPADVVLIGNNLAKFVETVRVAPHCRRIILQNFYGTLIVDTDWHRSSCHRIPQSADSPFFHVASELTFILNSTHLRLRNGTKRSLRSSHRHILEDGRYALKPLRSDQ
jgi:cation transport ATPase